MLLVPSNYLLIEAADDGLWFWLKNQDTWWEIQDPSCLPLMWVAELHNLLSTSRILKKGSSDTGLRNRVGCLVIKAPWLSSFYQALKSFDQNSLLLTSTLRWRKCPLPSKVSDQPPDLLATFRSRWFLPVHSTKLSSSALYASCPSFILPPLQSS